jgi:hypothetical protein
VGAEHGREEEEMIIMDPDALVAPRLPDHRLTEALIGLDIRRPLRLLIPHVRLKQMQQRPERAVTDPVIIAVDIPCAQEHRDTAMLVPELALEALPGRRGPEGLPRPANPEAVALRVGARQRCGQPPRTAGDRHVTARLMAKRDGQPI